jgi:hypothetical protein
MGNVVALSDSAGNLAESYDYTPFGLVTVHNPSGTVIATSAVGNPYQFTGRRLDEETRTPRLQWSVLFPCPSLSPGNRPLPPDRPAWLHRFHESLPVRPE